MFEHERIGRYTCKVRDMTEPNIKPQESGSLYQTVQASLSDGETAVTFTALDKPYELGIKPYSDWALCFMKHREDEARTGTYITVSAFQKGIGSGSCGPLQTLPKYCFPVKPGTEFTFSFIVG